MQFQWYAMNFKVIRVINFLQNSCLIVFISENQRTNELTYSNMQIIAREVELQTMRRSAPKDSTDNNATKTNKTVQKPKPQNHLQRLNTKGAVAKTKDLVRFIIFIVCFHHFLLEKSRDSDGIEEKQTRHNLS